MIPPNSDNLDPGRSRRMGPPPGSYCIVAVAYDLTLRLEALSRADGSVQHEVFVAGPHVWRYLTGPLPETLPARRLDSEWVLVSTASTTSPLTIKL